MYSHNKTVGGVGESYAKSYLEDRGHRILRTNIYSHWGELDIISEKEGTIHFIEVKTRIGEQRGKPYENVHYRKLLALARTIKYCIMTMHLQGRKYQLDVVGIVLSSDLKIESITLYENIPLSLE